MKQFIQAFFFVVVLLLLVVALPLSFLFVVLKLSWIYLVMLFNLPSVSSDIVTGNYKGIDRFLGVDDD